MIVLDASDRQSVLVSDDGTVDSLRNVLADRYKLESPKVLALFSEVTLPLDQNARAIAVHVDTWARTSS